MGYEHPALGKLTQRSQASDFGGDNDCLVPEHTDQVQALRIRIVAGKCLGTFAILDKLFRNIEVHNMSLPSALPAPLSREAVARIKAFMSANPSVFFHGAPSCFTEEGLKEVFARAGLAHESHHIMLTRGLMWCRRCGCSARIFRSCAWRRQKQVLAICAALKMI